MNEDKIVCLAHRWLALACLRGEDISIACLACTKHTIHGISLSCLAVQVGPTCNPSEPQFYHIGNGDYNPCLPHLAEVLGGQQDNMCDKVGESVSTLQVGGTIVSTQSERRLPKICF